jgi:hypothetical protein
MLKQIWGVIQRINIIEDLILMSPDPEQLQIEEMSLLVFRLLFYTNRGL